jgi:hypothetical protein
MITFFEFLNSGIPAQPACQQFYFAILHIFNINSDSKFPVRNIGDPHGYDRCSTRCSDGESGKGNSG